MDYLKSQRLYLLNVLRDSCLELSNNHAERSIKPFVINRKNFLFANTATGATGSAVIFWALHGELDYETKKDSGCAVNGEQARSAPLIFLRSRSHSWRSYDADPNDKSESLTFHEEP